MKINTQNTMLLVLDMQAAIISKLTDVDAFVSNVNKAIVVARTKGVPVIYVKVGFRPGANEISQNNKAFGAMQQYLAKMNMDDFMELHPSILPAESEPVVIKRRVSAFSGSDLDVILRSAKIDHIILVGYTTSGVVLATLFEASDKDYRVTLISDCCADQNSDVHQTLVTEVFPRKADVITIDEWGN